MRFLYSIKDNLIGFGTIRELPMVLDLPNDDVARRVVQDACADGQKPNALNTHPENKELWRLGSIDEVTGVISPCDPILIARAIEYIGKERVVHEDDVN